MHVFPWRTGFVCNLRGRGSRAPASLRGIMARRKWRRRRHRFLFWLLGLLAVAAAILLQSNGLIYRDRYDVTLEGLPPAFEGYRIAQVSDVHGGELLGKGGKRLIEALKKEQPHLIVITGDLVDGDHGPETVRELLMQLPSVAPCYYVSGNHEWSANLAYEMLALMEEAGITPLRNDFTYLTLGESRLMLAGLEDKFGPADQKTAEELTEEIEAEDYAGPVLLLTHRPDAAEKYGALGYDLVFAGHVHGGLVRLPFVGGLIAPSRAWFPPYTKGLYELENGGQLLVSAGLAPAGGLPRVFNPLQIPVAVLHGG